MTYRYSLNLCFPFRLLVLKLIVDHGNISMLTLIMRMLLKCLKQKTSVPLNEENFLCTNHHILPFLVSTFKFCCSHANVTIHECNCEVATD